MANEDDTPMKFTPRHKPVPQPRHTILKAIPPTVQALHAALHADPTLLMTKKELATKARMESHGQRGGGYVHWERIGAHEGELRAVARKH